MTVYTSYLLRTGRQIAGFRARYARFLASAGDEYVSWINSLPLWEWIDLRPRFDDKALPVVIGLICILYIDGKVNISFNETATGIRREDGTEEEWGRYFKSR